MMAQKDILSYLEITSNKGEPYPANMGEYCSLMDEKLVTINIEFHKWSLLKQQTIVRI